jgi:hypothetical protein
MLNRKAVLTLTSLFAVALTACEPEQEAELAETSDNATVLAALTCNDVFQFIDNPVGPTFTAMAFTFARAGTAVAGVGSPSHDSSSADLTTSGVSTETYQSTNADRAIINFRKTFMRLGTGTLQRTSRVAVEIYRNSTQATVASFDVGVTECTVSGTSATVKAQDANGGQLVMVFHHNYIGG